MKPSNKIFAQTSPGSFNDQALAYLIQEGYLTTPDIEFAGTQKNAMKKAVEEGGLAFMALRNDIAGLVPTTIEALQNYGIEQLPEVIRMKIEMCLIRRINETAPLKKLTSHPTALKQISKWKELEEKRLGHEIELIDEPLGTSKVAEQLSNGEFDPETGIIAPEWSVKVYPEIEVVEKGIQDTDNNYTHFGLMSVAERVSPISKEQAREELESTVQEVRKKIKETSKTFYQIAS